MLHVGVLHAILGLGFRDSLPLHIFGAVDASALQRDDVIHDKARTRPVFAARKWARIGSLEVDSGRPAAFNMTACVALAIPASGGGTPVSAD
jgi:hypothetical protein